MTHFPETVMDTDTAIRFVAPCPICGKSDYEWGFAKAQYRLTYLTEGLGWLSEAFSSGENLTARSCQECGHVALFRKQSRS